MRNHELFLHFTLTPSGAFLSTAPLTLIGADWETGADFLLLVCFQLLSVVSVGWSVRHWGRVLISEQYKTVDKSK